MSCEKSNNSCCGGSFLFWALVIAAGALVVANIPEIKRYIKISSM
jgi:hypothetical protein